MKKLFVILWFLFFTVSLSAQKGTGIASWGVDFNIPTGNFGNAVQPGFGIYGKLINGSNTQNHFILTTGYTFFKFKGSNSSESATWSIIPMLIGMRQDVGNGIYVEPQVGYSVNSMRIKSSGITAHDSEGAFTWSLGMGCDLNNKIEIAIRYQSAEKKGSLSLVGIHLGYNFSFKSKT